MKRLFFAVDIVPEPKLLEAFEMIRYRLRLEKINWVTAKQMHLTLAFLGETPAGTIPSLIAGADPVLTAKPCFELTLSSVGVFKSLRDPTVLWTGCNASAEFQFMKKELDKALVAFGHVPESRPFSPHLTLGRIRGMRDLNQLSQVIALYRDAVFQHQVIRHVTLYESRLTPSGPEYTSLKSYRLRSGT
jgi:RNA 2',3'-cyclic 3'-phosphodiesterase